MTSSLRLLRWGGLAAWLGVGLPIWLQLDQTRPAAFAGWLAAWLLFAAALWATTGGVRGALDLPLLAFQAAAVMALVLLLCDGFEGTLLVLVAMQLAPRYRTAMAAGPGCSGSPSSRSCSGSRSRSTGPCVRR